MEQYRSSLAEIESNILVGDIDDELLSQQVKEKVIEKFKDAKEKLENSRNKIIELEQENSWIDWLSQHHEKFTEWENFSKEEMQDALNKFVERILVRFDVGKNEHIITIKFKLPLVNDSIKYNDPDDKSAGYKVKTGKDKLEGNLPVPKGGRPSKKNPSLHHHSTVTDFARLRGWSTSVPFSTAVK